MNFVYTFSCVITVSLIVHYIILINLSLSLLDINILQIDYILFAQHAESGPTQKCYYSWTLGRVKDEKSQLGITAICFFGTILHGETEFTALLMF